MLRTRHAPIRRHDVPAGGLRIVSTGDDEILVEFSASDPSELSSLSRWLDQEGVRVAKVAVAPDSGTLGLPDILTLVGGGTTVVAAIKILPEYIRSRRPSFRLEAMVKGENLVLDAKNADAAVTRLAERIIDSATGD